MTNQTTLGPLVLVASLATCAVAFYLVRSRAPYSENKPSITASQAVASTDAFISNPTATAAFMEVPAPEPAIEIPVHQQGGSDSAQSIVVDWFDLSGPDGTPEDPFGAAWTDPKTEALGDCLWIRQREGLTQGGLGYKEDYWIAFSSSLPISAIAWAAPNDFVVALEDGPDWIVFERWYLQLPAGAYASRRPTYSGPNPPVATAQLDDYVVGGGPYIPLANRKSIPSLRRIRLPQKLGSRVTSLAVDPHGRYAVVTTPDQALSLSLSSGSLTPIISAAALTMGHAEMDEVGILYADSGARSVLIESGPYDWAVVIYDNENDGVFDTHVELHDYETIVHLSNALHMIR